MFGRSEKYLKWTFQTYTSNHKSFSQKENEKVNNYSFIINNGNFQFEFHPNRSLLRG